MLKASRQGKWSSKTSKGNLRYLIVGIAFYLDSTIIIVSSDGSTVDLHYRYNDSFSCLVSFRSAFLSQQYKLSLNLML